MSARNEGEPVSLIPLADIRRVFDAVPTSCLILDPGLNIVAANEAYLRDTMTCLPDILGRPVFEVFPDNPENPDASGVSRLRASLERTLRDRKVDCMPVQRYDIRRPLEVGGGFEERHWSPTNVPVLDEEGKVAYIVHWVEDVTDFQRLSNNVRQSRIDREALQASIEALEVEMLQRTRERQEIGLRLLDSEQKLSLCQQIGRIGTFEWQMVSNEVRWSAEIAALYGLPLNAITTSFDAWRKSVHPEDRAVLEKQVAAALKSRKFEAEWRVVWPDGTVRWLAGRAEVYLDETGRPQRMLGVNIDITERKAAEELMRRMAQHDPLTGLPNRALFYEYAEHLLPAVRRGRSHAAFLFVDLDRFKPINDSYGHDVGDAVLKDVGARLTDNLRGGDMVGRLGGDEFVAVLAHVNGEEDVARITRHLLDHLGRPYLAGGIKLHVSPSIGISLYPQDGDAVDELIKRADVAMYAAKQCGRNNFQFFRANLDTCRA